MSEEKKFVMGGGLVISEVDRSFTKVFEGDSFTVRIPTPFEKTLIIRKTAELAGGNSASSLGEGAYDYIRMGITLNVVIKDHPAWWEGVDNCLDDEFLESLWRFYLESEKEFGSRLKSFRKQKGVAKPK